jgi:SecD/SecF fusion protein
MHTKRRVLYWSLFVLVVLLFIYQRSNSDVSKEADRNGGVSVTMEILIPDIVKKYIRNRNDIEVKRTFEFAKQKSTGADFIEQFVAAHKELNIGKRLVSYLSYAEIEELDRNSTDAEVFEFLMKEKEFSISRIKSILEGRINRFGIVRPVVKIDERNNRIYIKLPGIHDEAEVVKMLLSSANLQFFETFEYKEIQSAWMQAKALSLSPEVEISDLENELLEVDLNDSIDKDGKRIQDSLRVTKYSDSQVPLSNQSMDEIQGLDFITSQYGNHVFVKLTDRKMVDHILKQRKDIGAIFPNNLKFMWGAKTEMHFQTLETGYILYAINVPLEGRAKVGSKDLKGASVRYDFKNGSATVNVKLTEEGDAKWSKMTARNVDKVIAMTMDEVVYCAPNVMGAIGGGRQNFQIHLLWMRRKI